MVPLFLQTAMDVDQRRMVAISPEFVWVEVEELLLTLSYSYKKD